MAIAPSQPITLKEFLTLPETKPASEYIDGKIIQKPMPKGKHSRLQLKLCDAINAIAEPQKLAYAFPELRCTFNGRSIVPDVAVFEWSRIAFDAEGEPPNDFVTYPDWTIEILSPEQRANRVTGNILHCIHAGCQLGWLVDPDDRSILAFLPNQEPIFCEGSDRLPVLAAIDLDLTAEQLFNWLKMAI